MPSVGLYTYIQGQAQGGAPGGGGGFPGGLGTDNFGTGLAASSASWTSSELTDPDTRSSLTEPVSSAA
jgi:hypothetical protein